MKTNEIRIPLTRASRELSRIIRVLAKDPEKVFIVTKNLEPYVVFTSVELNKKLKSLK